MSMTITLCKEDEEHIFTVEPGENLIDILTNILGTTYKYTFIIDGKQLSSLTELSKYVQNNTIIKVQSNERRAFVSPTLQGCSLELKSPKNPSRPVIKIQSVHISCSSDSYDPNENMAGFIVYSFDDKQMFELNGYRCRTGYILIKATKNIQHINSNQGIVHGSLFKWFFGIEPDNRFVGAGFALHEGKFKFNSGVFNARNDDYHDDSKSMSEHEISLIKYTLTELYITHKWRQNQTLFVKSIGINPCYPGDSLPIQNHPKTSMT